MAKKKVKFEGYNTRIGPLLKKVFEVQKKNVEEVTYGTIISDYDAGEIIAKKILDNKLV
ncbi:MAG: hypothetical protein ACTSQ4_02130 [Candidatus Heimdallarchaeaceae archaeon]